MDKARDVLSDIYASDTRVLLEAPQVKDIEDILSFGFSFIEHEDFMVAYVAADPQIMKQILTLADAQIRMKEGFIGTLWTSELIVSDRVKKNHIFFSNADISVVLDLDKTGAQNGTI